MASTTVFMERRRTWWDMILGVLLLIAGMVILGHAVLATAVSVLFIGWMALLGGGFALGSAIVRIGKDGFWSAALSAGLLVALGLMFIRNPGVAALTLTLMAGTLFLFGGVTRIVAALQEPDYRWVLLFGGVASAALGLLVFFNIFEATLTLLGVLLGIEVLIDGMVLLLVGRLRVARVEHGADIAP